MVRAREIETNEGIQGEVTTTIFDQFARGMRDKGWMETNELIKSGITSGHALEVGPGPGYLGLEWLKKTHGTTLTGLDISPDMIALSKRNAQKYGLAERTVYTQSNGSRMQFKDGTFDAVFTNGSLHEWEDPGSTFDEIWRVLKPGGRVFISDLRRDMFFLMRWFLWVSAKPKAIRGGLTSSIHAAYTSKELDRMITETKLKGSKIEQNLIGLTLSGVK